MVQTFSRYLPVTSHLQHLEGRSVVVAVLSPVLLYLFAPHMLDNAQTSHTKCLRA